MAKNTNKFLIEGTIKALEQQGVVLGNTTISPADMSTLVRAGLAVVLRTEERPEGVKVRGKAPFVYGLHASLKDRVSIDEAAAEKAAQALQAKAEKAKVDRLEKARQTAADAAAALAELESELTPAIDTAAEDVQPEA